MQKSFTNPWPKPEPALRLVSNIPTEVHDFLCGIAPTKGTKQILLNILLEKIINECKRRNINNSSQREVFEQFILNCELVAPGDSVDVGFSDGKGCTATFIRGVASASTLSHTPTPPLTGGTAGNGATLTRPESKQLDIQSLRGKSKPRGTRKAATSKSAKNR